MYMHPAYLQLSINYTIYININIIVITLNIRTDRPGQIV